MASIGDVDIASGINSDSLGPTERRARSRAPVTEDTGIPGAGYGGDCTAGRRYLSYPIVPRISDIQITGRIEGKSHWGRKTGAGSRSAIANQSPGALAAASYHRNRPSRGDPLNQRSIGVTDVNVTKGVSNYTASIDEVSHG
jgi:hypothetical protein